MKRTHIAVAATLFALALPFTAAAQHDHGSMNPAPRPARRAAQDPIFVTYEQGRQALIQGSLPRVKGAAAALGQAARDVRQAKLAELATTLERAADLGAAREVFAALSDEAIRYRSSARDPRPNVVWCAMEKKSWMQPKGKIGNPYVDASMRTCGELVHDDAATTDGGTHRL